MSTPMVVSRFHSLQQYKWGNDCEAWNFLDNKDLSLKLEKMPSGAEEQLHFHKLSQQFFFILKGKAVFEVDDVILIVHEGEGLHIESEKKHRIVNKNEVELKFLVCSQPATDNDRYNIA